MEVVLSLCSVIEIQPNSGLVSRKQDMILDRDEQRLNSDEF
jgi:hypothetical protein